LDGYDNNQSAIGNLGAVILALDGYGSFQVSPFAGYDNK
jgi:hypothetical protein